MNTLFLRSIQSEWMKTKGSAAFWLVLAGGFFMPAILLVAYLVYIEKLSKVYSEPQFWENWLINSWQSMAALLLPMGIVLATSLMAQLEYRNNTWKQLHTTPQSFRVVFFAKLTVILLMMVQLFVLFNIGVYFSGAIPTWVYKSVSYPEQAFPWYSFFSINGSFFIMALPVVALQYLLSTHFKNFMVSLGVGLALVVGSLVALSWKYFYLVPYTYCAVRHAQLEGNANPDNIPIDIHYLALLYFTGFIFAAYLLYIHKKEKG